jgi:hypothetical protein
MGKAGAAMKGEANEIIGNADYEVFTTNGVPGYLEYAGGRFGWHVVPEAQRGDMERCYRLEVRETRNGFQVHKVSFERAMDWRDWRERNRELKSELFQSSLEAAQYIKEYECAASTRHIAKGIQCDIVDMVYDDGLTPKEALEVERLHRLELAREFRQAAKSLRIGMVQERQDYER